MTSHDREFMNRVVTKIIEIDGGELTTYSGDYDFYERERAIADAHQQAAYERQQAMLKKELAFIERFKARARHAAQVQSRVKKLDKIEKVEPPKRRKTVDFEFRAAAALRRGRGEARGRREGATARRTIYDGLDFLVRRGERWCVMGVNGAGKSTLLKLVAGESAARRRRASRSAASVKMGYFAQHAMELLDADEHGLGDARRTRSPAPRSARCARSPAASASPATRSRSACRVLSGGEKARLVLAQHALRPAELPGPRRADQPPRRRDARRCWCARSRASRGRCSSSPTTGASSPRSRTACSSSTPEGPIPYGGGYTEYVARTGREAPGLRAAPVRR